MPRRNLVSPMILSALLLLGCSSSAPRAGFPSPYAKTSATPVPANIGVSAAEANPDSNRVMVIVNVKDPGSVKIARYYCDKRKIPRENVFATEIDPAEEVSSDEFNHAIRYPLQKILEKRAGIDFLVMTRGVPIRLDNSNGYSTDATLAGMFLRNVQIPEVINSGLKNRDEVIRGATNPYLNAKTRFRRSEFKNLLLVTRLDGYTVADAMALVDRSLAAKPHKGPFFFDKAGNRNSGGYQLMQKTLDAGFEVMRNKGFTAQIDESATFKAPSEQLAGYASWGSNDGAFDLDTYRKLRFKPGAISETFVSTSGRTFRKTSGGQSLIADLIAQGITGVKGYVSEPYTFALAQPQILFDRYTAGWNLAESMYAASPVIKWKDVVIGDPLCNPYQR